MYFIKGTTIQLFFPLCIVIFLTTLEIQSKEYNSSTKTESKEPYVVFKARQAVDLHSDLIQDGLTAEVRRDTAQGDLSTNNLNLRL